MPGPLVLAFLYALAVGLVASEYMQSDLAEVSYVAARTLEPNRRIAPDDLKRPPTGAGRRGWLLPDASRLQGKYVASPSPIQAGAPVRPADVQAWPDLKTVSAGHRLVTFTLDKPRELADLLNVGSFVDVAGAEAKPFAAAVPVRAVVCPAPVGNVTQPCYAVVEVCPAVESAVSAKREAARLVPVSPPSQPPQPDTRCPS